MGAASNPDHVSAVLLWYNEYAMPWEVLHGFFHICVFRTLIQTDQHWDLVCAARYEQLQPSFHSRRLRDFSVGTPSVENNDFRKEPPDSPDQRVAFANQCAEALTDRWWPCLSD